MANAVQEKREGVITLPEPAAIIRSILDFCYSGSYDLEERTTAPVGRLVLHHAMVFAAADKYKTHALKKHAEELSRRDLTACLEPVEFEYGGKWFTWKSFRNDQNSEEELKMLFEAISFIHHQILSQSMVGRAGCYTFQDMFMEFPWEASVMEDHRDLFLDFLSHTPEYATDLIQGLNNSTHCDSYYYKGFVNVQEFRCSSCAQTVMLHVCLSSKDELVGHCFSCGRRNTDWKTQLVRENTRPKHGW